MGAAQSGGVEIGGSSMGFQVLRVYPNSPGSKAGLKAYFDFIIAIGNTRFNKEDGSLPEILKASVDQKLKMAVFNTRTKALREVEIVPTTSWGGSGLLGISIKHSSFDKADERVWHVTQVDPGSPAQQAGFKAMNDYVIGSDSTLQESDDLYQLIEAHEGKALKLFVYNLETDNCREIICYPNSKWGGRGFLGCEFGHGLLHRIPFADSPAASSNRQPSAPAQPSMMIHAQASNGTQILSAPSQQQTQSSALNRAAIQPGQQLFHQALYNDQSYQQSQAQSKPVETKPATLPQAPQTFAQLASAQFQAQQYQQQTEQIQQQQHLLNIQRQQLEQQRLQVEEQLAASKQQQEQQTPVQSPVPQPSAYGNQTIASEQQFGNYPSPPLPSSQQPQYPLQAQISAPPPPPSPPASQQAVNQQLPTPMQFQQQQTPFVPQHNRTTHQQPNPYQSYPYPSSQLADSTSGGSSPSSNQIDSLQQSNLPPSIQTLPPPPTMYPSAPTALLPSPLTQSHLIQQQQQQQQQQAPSMYTNQM